MYIVGQAYSPEENEDASASLWAIEIHKVSDMDPDDIVHLGCIQIYEGTIDLCVLKAKIICGALNAKRYVNAEILVEKLCANKSPEEK